LDNHFFSVLGSITWKVFNVQNLMQIDDFSKKKLHVQNNHGQWYFSQTSFFVIKCASFLLKIGEDINIDG
jgi:hypothetical protein